MKKKISLFTALLFIISSCSYFINWADGDNYDVMNLKKPHLNIVFSNNIHGETHPCGCRHFPLGGLPQVAGKFNELKKTGDFLYVDTGDTLFPSNILPKWLAKSLTFSAKNLARALDQLGLDYFVPGEKDFAAGVPFLQEIAKSVHFKFLITNLKDPKTFQHIKYAKLEYPPHSVYLLGIVLPDTMGEHAGLFSPPDSAIDDTIKLISKDGYDAKNPFHRLIVLSHSGIDEDKLFAKKHPQIDWILGSHTQSFTTFPMEEGNTKIVQVLSRNHYLGQLKINFKKSKKNDSYKIHEVRDELSKLISPNPFDKFIIEHKAQVAKLQTEEQQETLDANISVDKFKTAQSCIGCHKAQSDHWQKTPHALAYSTLVKVGEQNNLTCIKCHSLGQGHIQGFQKAKDIVQFAKPVDSKEHAQKYWSQVKAAMRPIKSVRQLHGNEINDYKNKWIKIDEKMQVVHKFANVQCLNCHDKEQDHPFEINTVQIDVRERYDKIQQKCLTCHDRDQSPRWYKKDAQGFPNKLNELKFIKNYKSFSCPEYQQ